LPAAQSSFSNVVALLPYHSGVGRHRVGVVVGNPKPRSRTLDVAVAVARAAAEATGLDGPEEVVVDLATLGPGLLDWSSGVVRGYVDLVAGCSLLVVGSPVYKASYTGLLKCFLDWFGTTGLSGVITVPVMVGAGATHALAVEVHLRPVLVEIGATLPTRGLYVEEADLPRLEDVIAAWVTGAAPALRRVLS
jgi:FMN reductase